MAEVYPMRGRRSLWNCPVHGVGCSLAVDAIGSVDRAIERRWTRAEIEQQISEMQDAS